MDFAGHTDEVSRLYDALETERNEKLKLREKVDLLEDQLDILALENDHLRKLLCERNDISSSLNHRQLDKPTSVEFLADLQDGDGTFPKVVLFSKNIIIHTS